MLTVFNYSLCLLLELKIQYSLYLDLNNKSKNRMVENMVDEVGSILLKWYFIDYQHYKGFSYMVRKIL